MVFQATKQHEKFAELDRQLKEKMKTVQVPKPVEQKPARRVVRPSPTQVSDMAKVAPAHDLDDEYEDEDFEDSDEGDAEDDSEEGPPEEDDDDEEELEEPEEIEEDVEEDEEEDDEEEPEEIDDDDDLDDDDDGDVPPVQQTVAKPVLAPPPAVAVPLAAVVPAKPPPKPRGRPPKDPSAPPKPRGRPPAQAQQRLGGPVSSSPNEVILADAFNKSMRTQKQSEDTDDLADTLTGLDFGTNKFKTTLSRVRPEFVDGKPVAGYLGQFVHKLTAEEIKNTYGGGTYRVTVTGPKANGRSGVLATRQFDIAGEANPVNSNKKKEQVTSNPESIPYLSIVQDVLKTKDAEAQQARLDAKEAQKQMFASMKNEGGGLKDILPLLLSLQNPSSLRDEMREERAAAERRMDQERENRRFEQEAQRQAHERQMEAMRQQHETALAAMKAEQQRLASEANNNVGRSESMFKDFLAMTEKNAAEKEARARENSTFLMTAMQQQNASQMAGLQEMEKMKSQFFMDQLKASKGNDEFTGLDKLLKFKEVLGSLTGAGDGDGRATWEKVLDRVGESAPGVLAAASMIFKQGAGGATTAAVQPPPQQALLPAPGVRPGTVAVVDLPPVSNKRRRTSPLLKRDQPQRQPVPQTPPPEPQVLEAEVIPEPEVAPEQPEMVVDMPVQATVENDLVDFSFPAEGMDTEPVIHLLVKNIDLGIQKGYESDKLFDEVISKFPRGILELLKLTTPEQALTMLGQMAPQDWYINSPAGALMVKELFDKIVAM